MRVREHLERVEILCVDHRVERFVSAIHNATGLDQTGVDLVVELRDHNEVVNRRGRTLWSIAIGFDQACNPRAVFEVEQLHPPQALIALDGVASLRKHAYLRATSDRLTWQLDRLRLMALEHEPEAAPLDQRRNLLLEVSSELRICAAKLT